MIDLGNETIFYTISSYLGVRDFCNLAGTCSVLYKRKPLVYFRQLGVVSQWSGPSSGHFNPFTLAKIPLQQNLKAILLECNWKDQGWGSRKGQIFFRLKSKLTDEIIASTSHTTDCVGRDGDANWLAPGNQNFRKSDRYLYYIKDHDIVERSNRGDELQLCVNVGGGGGHGLDLSDVRYYLEYTSDTYHNVNVCPLLEKMIFLRMEHSNSESTTSGTDNAEGGLFSHLEPQSATILYEPKNETSRIDKDDRIDWDSIPDGTVWDPGMKSISTIHQGNDCCSPSYFFDFRPK